MSDQLTAKGSIPPRPGNAFDLYKEKLKVAGKYMEIDTSTAAAKEMWKMLPEHEKKKFVEKAKEKRVAFDMMYPDWRKKAPKNKEVANKMEELRKTAQVPQQSAKLSLAAGMPVAQFQPMAPRVILSRFAMTPLSHVRQPTVRITYPVRRLDSAPSQYGAVLQQPELQGLEQQENQNYAKMYVGPQTARHRYNPY
ncbi:hypothetical protein CAEBREN_07206 [Caenorhabditis brenneri]|uniref:HMG box domain-containing protein n=1 Tax=Caenorhabditis brenneri TaxID=135651 RepID=G0NUD6_CAEBE|nr:hypothetical protein CAEBREN_07206 [Caenorhabditis brenneri]